jgi:uncharacterized protein YxeA
MKLLFTKLQEEITTVKKSVTQFRVETGSADFKAAEFPVIELKPESQRIERAEANRPPKASLDDRKAPLALNAKAEQVSDVVDLQGISKKGALSPVTYSASRALKTKPYLENFKNDSYSKSENDCSQEKVSVYNKPDDCDAFSALEEKRARYTFTTRKFIATQEMIEYHTSREKKVSFELTI